ncbi:RHS repeat domain-containing protein [Xanthomonas tesorieronis]|uniref:RHS repeat domain-containing protein n=1 Tax=Xanthomonas tesorieronis TaxID=3160839 RepID=UPI003517D22E
MNLKTYSIKLCIFIALLILTLLGGEAKAEAWIELTGPTQTSYTAPATYQFQIKSGVIGTGPKAEYLSDIRLLRNNVTISTLPTGTYSENGISAGTYEYVLKATAIRNVNGDEVYRQLSSQVVTITVAAPPVPFDGAEYVSMELPGAMDRGVSYAGAVTFRNTGNTTWRAGDGYRLGQASGYSSAHFGIGEIAVPYDVAPGSTARFTFTATAPQAIGEYLLQWQMNRNGSLFGSTSGNQTIVVAGKFNNALPYEQDVPRTMEAGRTYPVKLRFRNTGNTTWSTSTGYTLGSWNPDNNNRWGVQRVAVRDQIAPQIGALFEFNVVAPTLPGVYSFQWRMLEEGVEWFGDATPDIQITVNGPSSTVIGNIDGVTDSGQINGWACSTRMDVPIELHVYVGGPAGSGTFALSGTANQPSEAGVATACMAGGSHRFSLQMTNELRRERAGKAIHIHGISPVGGPNNEIGGSGSFVVPPGPSGTLSVEPAICTLAIGAQSCNVRLTWSANDSRAQVVRSVAGTLVASGRNGTSEVGIQVGVTEFALTAGGDVLARASATAKAAPTGPGTPSNPAPTLTRRYVYDENLRLCKVIEPETGSTVFAYDAAGNIKWSVQGLDLPNPDNCNYAEAQTSERRIVRTYDVMNRLRTLEHGDGLGDQILDYAPDGLIASTTTYNQNRVPVVTTRSYNSLRVIESEQRSVGAQAPRIVEFGYNTLGEIVRTRYPNGYEVRQTLNAMGEAVRLEDGSGSLLAGNISYSPAGMITTLTYGNGIVRHAQANARNLVSEIKEGSAVSLTYSYDAAGNISKIEDGVRGVSGNITLDYDPLNRLVQASAQAYGGSSNYSFAYDTLDNIVYSRLPGKRESNFIYDDNNRLELVRDQNGSGVSAFAYDVSGNMINRDGHPFLFDVGGRLRAAGNVQRYLYDAAGYRASAETAAGDTSTWHYLASGQLINSKEGGNESDYIYLGDQLIAIRNTGSSATSLKYMHHDALGSLAGTSDASGTVLEHYFWTPYGESDNPIQPGVPGFTGHISDSDTGLVYMGQRLYDPKLARFISVDPLAASNTDGVAFNRYLYANNNPFRFSDPSGNCAEVTGSHMCDGKGFAGSNVQVTQYTESGVPIHNPNAAAPAPESNDSTFDAFTEAFTERNWFTGQGSLTDVDAVAESIIAPLMNSPAGGTMAGGAKVAGFLLVFRVGNATKGFGNLTRAGEFGLGSYNALRKAVGVGSGTHVHHLIEKRFASLLGQNKGDMLSVVVTRDEHKAFSAAWRAAIPTGQGTANATRQDVMNAARRIYANYPAIREALGL